MDAPLELLMIEDNEADFMLIARQLRRGGLEAKGTRVASDEALTRALTEGQWDLVLADYSLPGMDFAATLERIRVLRPELPIVLVSGAIGEERAVELLRSGVRDFVLKDHLTRLAPVIERCLREVKEQRAHAQAEVELRVSEERLRLALEGGGLGMWDWDLSTGSLLVSDRSAKILGDPSGELLSTVERWEERVHPEDRPTLSEALVALWTGRLARIQVEHRMRHRDGHWVWIATHGKTIAQDPEGHPTRVCGTHQDISERKRLEQEMRILATTDPLTGAFNRRHLIATMEAEVSRTLRYARPLCLIMLDLDRFKSINDALGHDAGDRTLVDAVECIGKRLRKNDTLGRWGGEELMILLPETSLARGAMVAEDLRVGLHTLSCRDGRTITASFGVTQYKPGEPLDQWLKRVDDLVFQAKHRGRDRVVASLDTRDQRPSAT